MKLMMNVPDEILQHFASKLDTDQHEVIRDIIMNAYDADGMCTHDDYQILYDRIDVKYQKGRRWIQT